MLINIEKYLKVLLQYQHLCMKYQIQCLQTSPDEETFEEAAKLFLEKWIAEEVTEFTDYFRAQWVEKNSNWYRGEQPGVIPRQTTALEQPMQ